VFVHEGRVEEEVEEVRYHAGEDREAEGTKARRKQSAQ
jgi:hypothetical protein